MPRRPQQITIDDVRKKAGRGGPREGAGRPRGPRPRVLHRERERIPSGAPVHVTIRVKKDVPGLRKKRLIREFRQSLAKGCERGRFRVVHYSVQRNHVHLLVEAAGKRELASGMKSVGARFARAVNRVFARSGRVLDGRFHHRVLRTPREVRSALAYVLLNARKHWREERRTAPPVCLDDASSAAWFDGWRGGKAPPRSRGPGILPGLRDVARPRSWLLVKGWRRSGLGLVDPAEIPGRIDRSSRVTFV